MAEVHSPKELDEQHPKGPVQCAWKHQRAWAVHPSTENMLLMIMRVFQASEHQGKFCLIGDAHCPDVTGVLDSLTRLAVGWCRF